MSPHRDRASSPRTTSPGRIWLHLVAAICGLAFLATSGAMATAVRAAGESTEPEARFAAANADLAAGQAARAIPIYRDILEHDGASPELLLNLGNASFRAGDVGGAVLAYERALLLAPRQAEVLANLRLVRREANLPADEPGLARWIADQLSMDGWAVGLLAALTAMSIVLLAGLLRGDRVAGVRTTPTTARAAAILLLALAAGAAAAWAVRWGELDRAVVVDGSEPFLRVAPYEAASRSTPLQSGQVVAIERRLPDFALVRTGDGRAGWAEARALARVVPEDS